MPNPELQEAWEAARAAVHRFENAPDAEEYEAQALYGQNLVNAFKIIDRICTDDQEIPDE